MSKTGQFLVFLAVAGLVTAGFAWTRFFLPTGPEAARRVPPPAVVSGILREDLPPRKIADFELVDSEDAAFKSTDLRGQVWVVGFFATQHPITRRQQDAIRRLCEEFASQDVQFVCITADPETDTAPVLQEHAIRARLEPETCVFLTGDAEKIDQIARDLQLKHAAANPMDWLVPIDRWGWTRGLFQWRYPRQLAALRNQLTRLLEETEYPHAADGFPDGSSERPEGWLREFTLTERSGQPFASRELEGRIWVASFFFSTCPSVCRTQNELVASLLERYGSEGVVFVSITCDPQTDTPQRLAEYARLFQADPDQWLFLTGDLDQIRRIGAEVFRVPVAERVHVERLLVMDRQGNLCGSYDWHDAGQLEKLKQQLDGLLAAAEGGDST